jgi:hypothetical protein
MPVGTQPPADVTKKYHMLPRFLLTGLHELLLTNQVTQASGRLLQGHRPWVFGTTQLGQIPEVDLEAPTQAHGSFLRHLVPQIDEGEQF